MSEFKIEKGIPMPAKVRTGGRHAGYGRQRYPFPDMEIGDSFFVASSESLSQWQLSGRLGDAASSYARRRPGLTFTTRYEASGVRVWRIT